MVSKAIFVALIYLLVMKKFFYQITPEAQQYIAREIYLSEISEWLEIVPCKDSWLKKLLPLLDDILFLAFVENHVGVWVKGEVTTILKTDNYRKGVKHFSQQAKNFITAYFFEYLNDNFPHALELSNTYDVSFNPSILCGFFKNFGVSLPKHEENPLKIYYLGLSELEENIRSKQIAS